MSFRKGGAGKRRDAIEPEIILQLRARGVEVWQIGGRGLPDLLCRTRGRWVPLEVKSGKNAPLTPIQARGMSTFPIVRSVDEALVVVGLKLPRAMRPKEGGFTDSGNMNYPPG